MKKITLQGIVKFLDDIKKELLLITWPTKKDMIISMSVVAFAVFLSAAIFFTADYCLHHAVQYLIKL